MKTEIVNSIEKLKIEFYKIQCKNWILSRGKGTGAAGRTLEELLLKEEDKLSLPDYYGIELKTKLEYSELIIGLFAMALDNRPLEMSRLLNLGGYPDKNYPQFKAFRVTIGAIALKKVGYYYYRLKIDYHAKVLRLQIFDLDLKLKEEVMSWSFKELKSRLEHKLSYLAFIPTKKYTIDNKVYFKYLDIHFYQLRDFATFLKLIETGKVRVEFKLSYYNKGDRFGLIHDRGTTFKIEENDLELLFQKIP